MFRITTVEASGPGAEIAKQAALEALSGRTAFVLPRNSVFLLPVERLREAILVADPEASAVSITRTSFSSLSIRTTPRAAAFLWCGTSIDGQLPEGCYEADSSGLVFKLAESAPQASLPEQTASTSSAALHGDAHGQVRVFGALTPGVNQSAFPIAGHVTTPGSISDALKFVDALRELGAPVTALSIRGDEADLWLGGPTRIIYVLGRERDAAVLAASALPTLNLKEGSIEYVDLRFAGKAYIKRYGE